MTQIVTARGSADRNFANHSAATIADHIRRFGLSQARQYHFIDVAASDAGGRVGIELTFEVLNGYDAARAVDHVQSMLRTLHWETADPSFPRWDILPGVTLEVAQVTDAAARPAPGAAPYDDTIDPPPVNATPSISTPTAAAPIVPVAGQATTTIFGFSPLVIAAAAAAGIYFLSKD